MADEEEVEVQNEETSDADATDSADSTEGVDANTASSVEAEDNDDASSETESKPEPAPAKEDEASAIAGIIERTLKANQSAAERQANEAAEREKIALMTPEQKELYDTRKEIENLKRDQLISKITHAESLDKIAIKSDAKMGELYKKYESKVEEKIKELRSQNNFTNRESVLRWVLGGVMIDSRKAGGPSKQKNAGAANIEKSTSKATSSKGQVRIAGGRDANSSAARAERLQNVRI